MKLHWLSLALLALPALAQTAAPAATQTQGDRIVATINGEALTLREFDQIWSRLTPQMRESYEKSGGKAQFLDVFIKRRLLIQEALKEGFDKRPAVATDLEIVRDSALFDRYVRDVVSQEVVPASEIRAYYDTHQTEFVRPEMIRVRHIVATPTKSAVVNTTGDNATSDEEALEKIKKLAMMFKTVGGNFTDVARQYSEDASAANGGDLGWFQYGRMVPEFDRAAFALKKNGETSGVVKTQFGYHVIQLVGRKPQGVAPFEEVEEQIREKLVSAQQARVLEEVTKLTNELRRQSRISVYPENL